MSYSVWYCVDRGGNNGLMWGRANMYLGHSYEGLLYTGSYLSDSGHFETEIEAHVYTTWRINNDTTQGWEGWEIRENRPNT